MMFLLGCLMGIFTSLARPLVLASIWAWFFPWPVPDYRIIFGACLIYSASHASFRGYEIWDSAMTAKNRVPHFRIENMAFASHSISAAILMLALAIGWAWSRIL